MRYIILVHRRFMTYEINDHWPMTTWQVDWLVEYCYTSHQLIYGYVDTLDYNDEIDTNHDLHFKDKESFTSHTT